MFFIEKNSFNISFKNLLDLKNKYIFVKEKHRQSGAKRREVTHSAELKALCTRTMRSLYIANQ